MFYDHLSAHSLLAKLGRDAKVLHLILGSCQQTCHVWHDLIEEHCVTFQLICVVVVVVVVCWSLTSLCHSNGHIETMQAREINPFTALTRIPTDLCVNKYSYAAMASGHKSVILFSHKYVRTSVLTHFFNSSNSITCLSYQKYS